MIEIRVARAFGRIDVDQFLNEIDPRTFAEQAAFDLVQMGVE